ncbi:MAG: UDP-N-acetylmuramoyl-L-alanyl-D-glutamate--2,6-diaminopimelate ligase [Prevotellaceae bacterium]|jgi:UDP-N-acetylmuramoyl-L-alanyl-D-glutamate--2,6-diaminopimelate ligase|nr:UDP-N-acetylmuramoyl-L-alanyl-D-glutamate--2,6-diaminopimelate ligase [Prevotellaceae bacterium]
MLLNNLIHDIRPKAIHGNPAVDIGSLWLKAQDAVPGGLFFALRGSATDGHRFIGAAIARGTVAVVCEELPCAEAIDPAVCYVVVGDSRAAAGQMASAFYGHPSRRLKLVGITGTNGKTTTATLLYRLFRAAGYRAGLLSTVANYVDAREIPATHTTPDAITINRLLGEMVAAGCGYCFMEVSSHAIVQERIAGLAFAGALFSNITHDHLDYHKTFADYIRAKRSLFDRLPAGAFALLNIDDRNGRIMGQHTRAAVKTYALRSWADFKARIVEQTLDGMQLHIDGVDIWTPLVGAFNAYNLLAVYAAARLLGIDRSEALRLLSALTPVAGRFEVVRRADGIIVIIDYAHTPDALQNVIQTVRSIGRETPLITVVGCGGNRDTAKRPTMAQIAATNSDRAVFTSDNPRFEDPEAILNDMKAGLDADARTRSLFITDRGEAIRTAIALAQTDGAIVLIAGKGHERYQEMAGSRIPFDDRDAALGLTM